MAHTIFLILAFWLINACFKTKQSVDIKILFKKKKNIDPFTICAIF